MFQQILLEHVPVVHIHELTWDKPGGDGISEPNIRVQEHEIAIQTGQPVHLKAELAHGLP